MFYSFNSRANSLPFLPFVIGIYLLLASILSIHISVHISIPFVRKIIIDAPTNEATIIIWKCSYRLVGFYANLPVFAFRCFVVAAKGWGELISLEFSHNFFHFFHIFFKTQSREETFTEMNICRGEIFCVERG